MTEQQGQKSNLCYKGDIQPDSSNLDDLYPYIPGEDLKKAVNIAIAPWKNLYSFKENRVVAKLCSHLLSLMNLGKGILTVQNGHFLPGPLPLVPGQMKLVIHLMPWDGSGILSF